MDTVPGLRTLSAENPGAMTGGGNHTYLVTGAETALIDAGVGHPGHLEAIAAVLEGEQVRLTRVIVTHAHPDHVGGAPAILGRWPGIELLKYPWPERDDRQDVGWRALADGARVMAGDQELEVLHTPGHAPDHVCLWHAPTRTLFGGDLLIEGSTVVVPGGHGGNLADYLASLARVAALAPAVVLPAHGPVITDPVALITRYSSHRAERERQILDAVAGGAGTVAAIVERVYPELMPELRAVAEMTVQAHLDKLRSERRIGDEKGRLTLP
jgi:glyoxylase-like metal-dependent hydrolase (beta-lactamase superfamily II)